MTVYAIVEHDPYLPEDRYSETIISVYSTADGAKQKAKLLNSKYAPYYYSVRPLRVYEKGE